MTYIETRDYFAGLAMQSLVGAITSSKEAREAMTVATKGNPASIMDVISKMAYQHADAMMKVRGVEK